MPAKVTAFCPAQRPVPARAAARHHDHQDLVSAGELLRRYRAMIEHAFEAVVHAPADCKSGLAGMGAAAACAALDTLSRRLDLLHVSVPNPEKRRTV